MGVARTVFLLCCAALVAGAGYLLYNETPDEPDIYLTGPGGRWGVQDLVWHKSGNQWVGVVTFSVGSSRHGIEIEADFATDLCAVLLTRLPRTPDGLASRKDVFRVDVQVIFPPRDDGEVRTLADNALSVSVLDGACQQPSIGDAYAPFLAQPSETLFIHGGAITTGEEGVVRIYRVFAEPGFDARQVNLMMLCNRLLADPWNLEWADLIETRTSMLEVHVVVPNGDTPSGTTAGVSSGARFSEVDGRCVVRGNEVDL